MSLFGWLFGTKTSSPYRPTEPTWQLSESNNPTIIFADGRRLTVFEGDGGYKFCYSKRDGDQDPFFSEPYETESAAKDEGLAFVHGTPSRHVSINETYRQQGRSRWSAMVDEKAQLLGELRKALNAPDLTVTQLRKIDARIATQVKQLEWQIDELRRRGVDDRTIALAERLAQDFPQLAAVVAERIPTKKAAPKT